VELAALPEPKEIVGTETSLKSKYIQSHGMAKRLQKDLPILLLYLFLRRYAELF